MTNLMWVLLVAILSSRRISIYSCLTTIHDKQLIIQDQVVEIIIPAVLDWRQTE